MDHLNQLIHELKQHDISNMIVSDPYSINYLVDYYTQPGERLLALLVRSDGQCHLFLNQLFPSYSSNDTVNVITYRDGEDVLETMNQHLLRGQTSVDKHWPSQFLLALLQKNEHLSPLNATYLLDNLRGIKSTEEQHLMRKASLLNDHVMEQTIDLLSKQLNEQEVATQVRSYYRELGHSSVSFEPIIAYGANGADPHHTTSEAQLKTGDSIVIDIGGRYQGYTSDMTRTVFYQKMDSTAEKIYHLVRTANEAAINMIKPGVKFSDIDRTARDIITAGGYGEYFNHRLGHFIGQEAHEYGDVSEFNHDLVQVGQIFSIEPGIYLPNRLGVRIEDLVLVTEDGCEVLNHFTKEPIIID